MKKIIFIVVSLLFFLCLGVGVYFLYNFLTSPVDSITKVFGDSKKLNSTDGRTNILAIGIDTRDTKYLQTGTLTDTLMVISVDPLKKDVKFLSLPRDLWVSVDGRGMKINEVYTLEGGDATGLEALKKEITETLGIDIHYIAKADFNSVVKVVDAVDGITINNPEAFTDNLYPKFGWENETCGIDIDKLEKEREKEWEDAHKKEPDATKPITFLKDTDFPCRYETLSFKEGEIHLDGETALKYARSRHSYDTTEGTDFARARRQQAVILAIKDKILNSQTLTDVNKIRNLFSTFSGFIETDFTINELITALPLVKDSSSYTIESKVLSDRGDFENGGVLVQGSYDNYGGRYVLIQKTPNALVSFVNSYFYSNSNINALPKPNNSDAN
ncbi:hypothetical protein COV24_04015 [candidate division WWE3 bacterium CG10_big_fil_rev_8_21_14_0_10_32_10]|uniref:Cell envelope-related transcriptional attenuator domain-containing protein n=1 Tax=candidate division WWE3 bacterium CG10_big_fil_rev_8_21_14_0_10_32_10 TaxID=1975090 RepID=A0A2H0R9H5_UNCKA|nr:MAG: hypothetical protein COV24_04015 [candidate division WWE3 bacterium CG10_big_fil_rev_8_21_14_0_10_32_10]